MPFPKVYADFHDLDDANRLRLTATGTLRDLERLGIRLSEDLALTFYTDDEDDDGKPDHLLADGVVHYEEASGGWVATVDWHALRHASDERTHGVIR